MLAQTETILMQDGQRSCDPPRIVLAGCGAVTRVYYAKALARLQLGGVARIVGIFDPDPGAMAATRDKLPSAIAAAGFDELLRLGADIAIIASPPCFHADQCVEALNAGLHVFCEKPLATNITDAGRILSTADAKGLLVAIGLVRRHFPATRSIKAMLENGLIGEVQSVSCFEGGPFDWPIASTQYFSRNQAGGGVLQDIGTHCLDLLTWWLGPPAEVEYADDGMGGIEANCQIRLHYNQFEANIRLSRDWARPNRYHIEGGHGWISWAVNETDAIELGLSGAGVKGTMRLVDSSGQQPGFVECFTAQLSSFMSTVRTGAQPSVTAEAGRDVLALIERCYAVRRLMDMPWLSGEERACAMELGED